MYVEKNKEIKILKFNFILNETIWRAENKLVCRCCRFKKFQNLKKKNLFVFDYLDGPYTLNHGNNHQVRREG